MTEQKTVQQLEDEYYSKPLSLSYSGLSKLMYSPMLYYKYYVLQEREEKLDSYLVDGKVIHCLLLDNGSFDQQFMLMPSNLPTGNSRLVIDKVFEKAKEGNLGDHSDIILEILKEINLHQSLKTDEQRVAKIITEENAVYYEFLKLKGNKTLLDAETLERCKTAVELLKNHPQINDLLGLHANDFNNVVVYNEKEFSCKTRFCGLHGVIDNIRVDYNNRNITINDLKTSGKTLKDFPETVEFYSYWAQAAIYWHLAHDKFKTLVDEGFEVSFNFIVIDRYNQVYAFPVTQATMISWCARLEEELNKAVYHYSHKSFELPYEFATGTVTL